MLNTHSAAKYYENSDKKKPHERNDYIIINTNIQHSIDCHVFDADVIECLNQYVYMCVPRHLFELCLLV